MYSYNKQSKLSFYDESFDSTLFFEDEIIDNKDKYVLSKKHRYVISSSSLKDYIYISTLNTFQTDDGICIDMFMKKTFLVPIGKDLYLLANTSHNKNELYSILHTFMINNSCFIDISKYNKIFSCEKTLINLYKLNK
ncbi:MAG: hypothetical protein MR270_06445 [Erysipelotrichaceae bacterium]|nr:hypothetical protein [Erysipelotrichaceae bacterium]